MMDYMCVVDDISYVLNIDYDKLIMIMMWLGEREN